ncbi:MAG: hypothetical protein IPM91_02435 [Bacteroidetes bacterium]|nr:hypothetical protein [Bacteroidota bacterium]
MEEKPYKWSGIFLLLLIFTIVAVAMVALARIPKWGLVFRPISLGVLLLLVYGLYLMVKDLSPYRRDMWEDVKKFFIILFRVAVVALICIWLYYRFVDYGSI